MIGDTVYLWCARRVNGHSPTIGKFNSEHKIKLMKLGDDYSTVLVTR